MGINTSGKTNYVRKLNHAYSQTFAENYLNKIDITINNTSSIKKYLENQKIKGALIGISYIWDNFNINNLKKKGYYSFYFFTDEKTKYNHGIILEISNEKVDENKGYIFQKKIFDNYITYYGLDYDQYLFQRSSIALIETNSDIFEKNNITLNSILTYIFSKEGELKNSTLIDNSRNLCLSICEYLNLCTENIYNIINDKTIPKGKDIIEEKILAQLNKNANNDSNFTFHFSLPKIF